MPPQRKQAACTNITGKLYSLEFTLYSVDIAQIALSLLYVFAGQMQLTAKITASKQKKKKDFV